MSNETRFPAPYRKNIRTVAERIGTDPETAFSMILMTATLTDLYPDDPKIAEYILADCGIEDGDTA